MLYLRKFPMTKKIMDKRCRVWAYQDFPSKIFCLTGPKNSVGDTFSVSPFSVKRIVYASEGCHDFLSKVFVSQYRKKTVEEHFCAVLQKNSGSEKLYG